MINPLGERFSPLGEVRDIRHPSCLRTTCRNDHRIELFRPPLGANLAVGIRKTFQLPECESPVVRAFWLLESLDAGRVRSDVGVLFVIRIDTVKGGVLSNVTLDVPVWDPPWLQSH